MTKKKSLVISAIAALLFSIVFAGVLVWMHVVDKFGNLPAVIHVAWAGVVCFFLMLVLLRTGTNHAVFSCLKEKLHKKGQQRPPSKTADLFAKILPATWSVKGVLCSAAWILLIWVPVLLFIWPGAVTPDTVNMLYQYATPAPTLYLTLDTVTNAEFINHHPLLDSLICGAFWSLGGLTGDHSWGVFFFALVDFVFVSIILGAIVCYLGSKLLMPRGAVIATQLFFMFCLLFPGFFSYLSKDAIFVPWFLLWMLLYIDIWRKKILSSWICCIAVIVVSVLCILTKQLAAFVVLPALLVLVFHVRPKGARIKVATGLIATPLIAFILFPAVAYPLVGGVDPGGKQEILGTPLNQAVVLYERHPEYFSQEEKAALGKVVDLDKVDAKWKNINRFSIDGVKGCYISSATESDIVNFLSVWFQKGCEHPTDYAITTGRICAPFFVPLKAAMMPGFSGEDYFTKQRTSFAERGLPWTELDIHQPDEYRKHKSFLRSATTALAGVPGLGIFFTYGFYSGWVPLLCFIALVVRCPRALWAVVPWIILWLLQILNPAGLMRYAMPFIVGMPLILAWTVYLIRTYSAKKQKQTS